MDKGVLNRERQNARNKKQRQRKNDRGNGNAELSVGAHEDSAETEPKERKKGIGEKKQENAAREGASKAMSRAMKAEVKKKRKKIAVSMVQKAIDGNTNTAAMILSLMEKEKEGEEGKLRGPSLAELLEAEPEWEESMEENSEVGSGGREPEMWGTADSR